MRTPLLAAVLAIAAAAVAQTPVTDIGMTVFFTNAPNPANMGQECGTVTCTPINVGPSRRGTARTYVHASAPITPYAMAVGFPGVCTTFPGISHGLLLDSASALVVAAGVTSHEPFVPTPCQQGLALFTLTLPPGAPIGVVFRVQGVGESHSGQIAFGPTLETVVQ